MCLVAVVVFTIQTVEASDYYGIETLYRIHVISKLDLAWVLEVKINHFNNSTVLGSLAIVLKHITSWRASEASETLSGVTQLKIGDICLYCM